ncbi:MAG: Stk1 family PASTA domain-containing Ser/Thr kinase [Ornithinimicrobium sp.]
MSTAPAPLIDRVLHGRYRVDAHMAEGGMASVYRGHDLRLDRPIALKIMRPDLARDLDFVARFQREARSAAKLSHPHVVSVYDQGDDDGLVYLVMELVPGRNLREIIHDEAPLPIGRASAIVDQILQALSAAHRAGLIHRDIKPENVLTDADGSVKVADFGLARAVTAGTMSRTSDVMWGTAAYLSPEQVQHGRADARTDVYAVGLVLYELLTGMKAFGGDSPIHVAFQHVHDTVPHVAESIPDTPGEVDVLIAAATATEPADRPEDAMTLRAALARVVSQLSNDELEAVPAAVDGSTAAAGSEQSEAPRGFDIDATRPVHQATAVVPVRPAGAEGNFARTTGNRTPKPAGTPARKGATGSSGPRRARRGLGAFFTVLLLLIGGGGAAAAWYFTAGPGIHSDMPVVVGNPEADAVAALRSADLEATVTPSFSETVTPGTVIAASQNPGTSLRHGSTVDLEVSQGPERYAVPDLTGSTVEEATQQLADTELTIGVVTQDFDENLAEGLILRSAPTPQDDPLPPDTAVDVVVSAGPEPIDVPSVVGAEQSEAEQSVQDAGFEVEVEDEQVFDTTVPAGSVATQTPAEGQANRGDTITLTISKGPELVTMPQVIGMQFGEAEPLLKDLGLRVKREEIAQAFFGTVRFQSVDEGEQIPVDTEVTLSVL